MKKLLIVLLLFSVKGYSQIYQAMPQPGYGPVKRFLIDSNGVLTLPLKIDGLRNITGGRDIGQLRYNPGDSTLYVYTGYNWRSAGTPKDTAIFDSARFNVTTVGPNKVFISWIGDAANLPDGLIYVNNVTTDSNTVYVTPLVVFRRSGITDTLPNGAAFIIDTAATGFYRKDAIYIDVDKVIKIVKGNENVSFAIPPLIPLGAILISYVDVFGNTVGTSTGVTSNSWVTPGNIIQPSQDSTLGSLTTGIKLVGNGVANIVFDRSGGVYFPTTQSSTDSTTNKPLVFDPATGKISYSPYWRGGGSISGKVVAYISQPLDTIMRVVYTDSSYTDWVWRGSSGGGVSGISKLGSPAYGLTRTNDSTYIADTTLLTSQSRTTALLALKWATSGNTGSYPMKLGTTNSSTLRIITNNNEVATIDSASGKITSMILMTLNTPTDGFQLKPRNAATNVDSLLYSPSIQLSSNAWGGSSSIENGWRMTARANSNRSTPTYQTWSRFVISTKQNGTGTFSDAFMLDSLGQMFNYNNAYISDGISGGSIRLLPRSDLSVIEAYKPNGTQASIITYSPWIFSGGFNVLNSFSVSDANGYKLDITPTNTYVQLKAWKPSVTDLPIVMSPSTGQVVIGTTTIDNSASLQITSTTKGFLPPRMTATQASAISSPAEGLLVYVTNTNGTFTSKGWWGYDGATWQKLNN